MKAYILGVGVILLFAASFGCYIFFKKWRDAQQENKGLIKLNSESFKEVTHYKNKLGNEVAKNEIVQLESATIKKLIKEGQLPILKEFEGLKRNYKNLELLASANMRIASNLNLKVNNDSTFNYQDEYRYLIGQIHKDSTTGIVVSISDTTTIPLDIVIYWKQKWFLGKKRYNAEAISKNKSVKITGLETIKISKK